MNNYFENIMNVDSKEERTNYNTLNGSTSNGLNFKSRLINVDKLGASI